MKSHTPLLLLSLVVLVSCVDTTGLTAELTSGPAPQSNKNAIVTVVEYADLQCPACKTSYELVIKPLLSDYGSKIRFEFHHMPLTSIHSFAMTAAEAAECAADQGKFWEFIDLAYAEQDRLREVPYDEWAGTLGLDLELFDRCRVSHIKRKAIKAAYDEAVTADVRGTPTYTVNGQVVEGTYDALTKAIDEAIANINSHL